MPIMGGMVNPVKESDQLPRLGGSLARLGEYVTKAYGGGSVTLLAHPESLGILLKYAMGSEVYTPGSPSEHVFTVTDEYPGFGLTVWSSLTSVNEVGTTWRFTDVFIRKLSIEGMSGKNLEVMVDFIGFNYDTVGAPYQMPAVAGAGSSDENADPRFKYIGSTVRLSPDDGPLVDFPNAEKATWEIDRAPEVRYGPSLTPTVIAPDRLVNFETGLTLDTNYSGWQFLNELFTGATSGGSATQDEPNGRVEVTYGYHPTEASPVPVLKIEGNGYNWQFRATRPDAEATPGIVDFDLTGILVAPSTDKDGVGTTESTVTLHNNYAAAY
jgi:hypothetical protein